MKFKTRKIEASDWKMLLKWWVGHKWVPPIKDALPDNGLGGLIIEEDGEPQIAGFIYQTNSKGCWLEYIISNPDYKKDRSILLDTLVMNAEQVAIEMGYKYMLFIGKSNGIRKSMKRTGWVEDPDPSYELMKRLTK